MEATAQLSIRLPESLIKRVEQCVLSLRTSSGLDLTRADVLRMLIAHGLDATRCDVRRFFPGLRRR